MIKRIIRLFVRKVLCVRKNETISDAVDRKKHYILRAVNRRTFSSNDLKRALQSLGLKKGDIVIVHASWRSFIGYDGDVKSVIDLLLNIVGKDGTIVMPSFTNNKEIFRYDDSSSAGYISEVFRKEYNPMRSLDASFSMCALGKDAKKIIDNHIYSTYMFDKDSPYHIAMVNDAKVLLMGLGKKPHKITLFHCITYDLRNIVNCYKNVYNCHKKTIIYDKKNKKIQKNIVDRNPKVQNNKRKFKSLFNILISRDNYAKTNKLDIYLFDSKDMYERAKKYIIDNDYNLYRGKTI